MFPLKFTYDGEETNGVKHENVYYPMFRIIWEDDYDKHQQLEILN